MSSRPIIRCHSSSVASRCPHGPVAGGHDREDEHWKTALRNLAARNGATGEPTAERVCVDRRRQWRQAGNIRHNGAIRSGLWMMAHPQRMIRRPKD